MAFKQPRVPQETGGTLAAYVRNLTMFLRDFCMASWNADRLKDTEIEKIRSDYTFDSAVREAIRKASGRNEKAIMALLDIDTLKASKNQAQDITAALDTLKKDNDYLFQAEKKTPHVVSVTSGINPEAQTKREQANEALRSLLGRGE